ncbi:NosR/NirI family protein [Aquitalea sp.]|uniref:NosR/NirI family protein n=1 Tax=Aquitalea sp. TaxID=1872623 RepID=UPI0025887529|nr:NosR/NirI family protein [Aquitalea sp.]
MLSACISRLSASHGLWRRCATLLRIVWLGLLCCLAHSPAAQASSYERELPKALSTDPDMCRWVDCAAVLPGATSFSLRKGAPPYVEGYGADKKLKGYVFLSTDIVDTQGYSGKPIVTLIGMDGSGHISGVRVLKHSEPILLVGIPENKLTDFLNQYLGRFAGSRMEIGGSGKERLDAISGATVTVIAENQLISRCAQAVAYQAGIMKQAVRPPARFIDSKQPASWQALLTDGSVQHLTVTPADIGTSGSEAYLDLYYGYLNAPGIGRSVLGDEDYAKLMKTLKPGEHALFIVNNGSGSFKGSGFVRGGLYDRIQVRQDLSAYTFRDTDYLNLYALRAAGAPEFRESGIFILRDPHFAAAWPWRFAFLANKEDQQTGAKQFTSFESNYWLPDNQLQGGRPAVELPQAAWKKAWQDKQLEIMLFGGWMAAVLVFFISRDRWVRRSRRGSKRWVSWPKTISWLIAIAFAGGLEMAQPSITQVLTVFHALSDGWNWSLFLSDPFIFMFWLLIVPTTLIWGRGLFCGWMCPFGSLSELLYKIGRLLHLPAGKLPMAWHNRLKWLKYAIFFLLLAVSFFSMPLAEKLAEVEPFKTTFLVGVLNRSWPFALFLAVLLGLSLFVERPFCKYLCPLGASLGLPSRFNWLKLRRKDGCTSCKACAVGCGSLSIDAKGRIDSRECLMCLDCMVMYYDGHSCPPLAQERKRREKAGQPLTPIGRDGLYIPIKPVATPAKDTLRAKG